MSEKSITVQMTFQEAWALLDAAALGERKRMQDGGQGKNLPVEWVTARIFRLLQEQIEENKEG